MTKAKGKDSEDSYSTKLDMCLTDGIVKTSSGLILGTVVSVFYFSQRRWPIVAGIGMGVGIAYANCDLREKSTEPPCDPQKKIKTACNRQ